MVKTASSSSRRRLSAYVSSRPRLDRRRGDRGVVDHGLALVHARLDHVRPRAARAHLLAAILYAGTKTYYVAIALPNARTGAMWRRMPAPSCGDDGEFCECDWGRRQTFLPRSQPRGRLADGGPWRRLQHGVRRDRRATAQRAGSRSWRARAECTDCAAGKYSSSAVWTTASRARRRVPGYRGRRHQRVPRGAAARWVAGVTTGRRRPRARREPRSCECMEGIAVLDGTSGNACASARTARRAPGTARCLIRARATDEHAVGRLRRSLRARFPSLREGLWHLRSCFTSPQAFDNCNASSINREPDSAFRLVGGRRETARRPQAATTSFNRQMCSTGNLGPFCGVCDDGFTKGSGSQGCVACAGQLGTRWASSVLHHRQWRLWLRWRINQPKPLAYMYALVQRAYHAPYDTGRFKVVWSTYQYLHDQRQPRHGGPRLRRFRRLLGFSSSPHDGHHAHVVQTQTSTTTTTSPSRWCGRCSR